MWSLLCWSALVAACVTEFQRCPSSRVTAFIKRLMCRASPPTCQRQMSSASSKRSDLQAPRGITPPTSESCAKLAWADLPLFSILAALGGTELGNSPPELVMTCMPTKSASREPNTQPNSSRSEEHTSEL